MGSDFLNNDKLYFDNEGRYHREGGPALEWRDGTKEWLLNGLLHREDGPAIEYVDGRKEEWWYEGKLLPSYVQNVEQLKSYIRNKILW